MSDPFVFDDPIIFKPRAGNGTDVFVPYINIPYKVVGGYIELQENPVRSSKVQIKDTSVNPAIDYWEIPSGIPTALQYRVDYTNGIVLMNVAAEGKTLAVTFDGKGISLIPASRVWSAQSGGNVTETIKDIINAGQTAIVSLGQVNTAITNAQNATSGANTAASAVTTAGNNAITSLNNAVADVVHLGPYNSATTYHKNNSVSIGGRTWRALQTTVGNTPVEGVNWTLESDKGADGTGTVTSLTSTTGTLAITGTATVPDLNVVTGPGANQIVKRDTNGDTPGNITGKAATVTTNANLTGHVTSVGNATTIVADTITDSQIKSTAAISWSKINKSSSSLVDLATRSASDLNSGTLSATLLPTGIDAAKIADGTVSNAEFQTLDGVTSAIQTQLNSKTTKLSTASDTLLASTSATNVTTFTPTAQGNFSAKVYVRVITAATNVTINLTYTSGSGAQTYVVLPITSLTVGDYGYVPFFFSATASAITLTVTAGTANQVYVSASIVGE